MTTLSKIMGDIESENEKRSWEEQTKSYWSVNVVVNGYGLSRDIPIQADDPYVRGLTETQMRSMVKKLTAKGFEVSVKQITKTIKRII